GVDHGGKELPIGEQPVDPTAGVDGRDQREERGGGGRVERAHLALAVRGEAGLAKAVEELVDDRAVRAARVALDQRRSQRGEPVADDPALVEVAGSARHGGGELPAERSLDGSPWSGQHWRDRDERRRGRLAQDLDQPGLRTG